MAGVSVDRLFHGPGEAGNAYAKAQMGAYLVHCNELFEDFDAQLRERCDSVIKIVKNWV